MVCNFTPAREFRAGIFFVRHICPRLLFPVLLCWTLPWGCGENGGPGSTGEKHAIRQIDEVLNDHAPELMKVDGVVGVYRGALENGEPCLVVMVRDDGPEKRNEIPHELEGYPVRLEIGGEIRPLRP